MIIPQHNLQNHLNKGCTPIFWVMGQEPYLFNETILAIKRAWQQRTQRCSEETIIDVHQSQDWNESFQNANTFLLFAEYRLMDLRFAKKTLDAVGKKAIIAYADNPNQRCLVLIQTPDLPIKQIQILANHSQISCVQVQAYTPIQFKKFISQRLQTLKIIYTDDIPDLIYHYHQANLLACNQFIEVLACMHDLNQPLNAAELMTYLRDQSSFSIYELGDACLNGQIIQAIHMLRTLQKSEQEPILILWVLSQEIRKIIQIHHLSQSQTFQTICQQLKIWSKKTSLYQKAWQRITRSRATELLKRCQSLDVLMKSNRSQLIWQELEQIAISLSSD